MVDMGTYEIKYLYTGDITPKYCLQMLMQKKYMNRTKSILLLNWYV